MIENPVVPTLCCLPEGGIDSSPKVVDPESEKRRHRRYRFREPILIRTKRGELSAVTQEISISGLSASTPAKLQIAEEVRLVTIVGEQIEAVVRRKTENVYGFEFLNVPPKVEEAIHALCKGLFPFRGAEDQ
jgi:c-di-GMP-binding flagellar brake protein YcgR